MRAVREGGQYYLICLLVAGSGTAQTFRLKCLIVFQPVQQVVEILDISEELIFWRPPIVFWAFIAQSRAVPPAVQPMALQHTCNSTRNK